MTAIAVRAYPDNMTTTADTTPTITLTGEPSRSKQAGPCWISVLGGYAKPTATAINAEVGATIEVSAKAVLRRSSRGASDTARASWTLVVTGDPADTVTVSCGSPQSVDAVITHVREA